MKSRHYTTKFFDRQSSGSQQSADVIVPLIVDWIQPAKVVDVGCGIGTWLTVFKKLGAHRVLGIDGQWVLKSGLLIGEDEFLSHDLTQPLSRDEQFDLVVSLEVAEHLPPEAAATFVDTVTSLGPVVLWSAAVPFQGGDHHVNEQWPQYWADLFRERGFETIDCIRPLVWNDERVEYWYAQNCLLVVRSDVLATNDRLRQLQRNSANTLSAIHPQQYLVKVAMNGSPHHMAQAGLRKNLVALWLILRNFIRRFIEWPKRAYRARFK